MTLNQIMIFSIICKRKDFIIKTFKTYIPSELMISYRIYTILNQTVSF